jgi:GTPase SAR1 family protein
MIFFIEGDSGSGKTTICNLLINRTYNNYNPVYFKGAGQINVGTGKLWSDYNWYMHNMIERLDDLNNRKIPIIWDRGVSEFIITQDSDLSRVLQCHKHKHLFYILNNNSNLFPQHLHQVFSNDEITYIRNYTDQDFQYTISNIYKQVLAKMENYE